MTDAPRAPWAVSRIARLLFGALLGGAALGGVLGLLIFGGAALVEAVTGSADAAGGPMPVRLLVFASVVAAAVGFAVGAAAGFGALAAVLMVDRTGSRPAALRVRAGALGAGLGVLALAAAVAPAGYLGGPLDWILVPVVAAAAGVLAWLALRRSERGTDLDAHTHRG